MLMPHVNMIQYVHAFTKGRNSKFPYPLEDIALIADYGSNPDTRSWDWDFYVAELSSVWVSFVGDSEIPGLHSLPLVQAITILWSWILTQFALPRASANCWKLLNIQPISF